MQDQHDSLTARQNRWIFYLGRYDYAFDGSAITVAWKALNSRQTNEYRMERIAYYRDDRFSGESRWNYFTIGLFCMAVLLDIALMRVRAWNVWYGTIPALGLVCVTWLLQFVKHQYIDFYGKDGDWIFSIRRDKANTELEALIREIMKSSKTKEQFELSTEKA